MFIQNKAGSLISSLSPVDTNKLKDCTLLPNITHRQARQLYIISLGNRYYVHKHFDDEEKFYDFINNFVYKY